MKELWAFVQKVPTGYFGGYFLKELTTYLLGNDWANCFKTHNELTMYPLGKCPLAPSVTEAERQLYRQGVRECDKDGVPKPVKTCMAYARAISGNAAEEVACLNDRLGYDGQGYFDLADNHNFQVDSASEVVDRHTIEVEALRAENMVL